MDPSSIGASDSAIQSITNATGTRAALQISLLRKSLDSQQEIAADLMKLLDGKGQNLDIRA